MQKRLSRKQAAQRKRDRRKSRVIASAPILVQTRKESGGKRKGKAMRKTPVEYRTGNVTGEMLDNAPSGAMAHVNSRGVVKMLRYSRES